MCKQGLPRNIARSTTDQAIELVNSVTSLNVHLSTRSLLLVLATDLATRWHRLDWLVIWPPGDATCLATLPRIHQLNGGINLAWGLPIGGWGYHPSDDNDDCNDN